MATVASWLETPSGVVFCPGNKDPRNDGSDSTGISVYAAYTAWVKWQSVHYTFQVQWRWRSRLSPAKAAATHPAGGDVWTEWGAWQGVDPDSSTSSSCTKTGTKVYLTDKISIPYDLAEADMRELQVRVRAYNEPTNEASEWCVQTLTVYCTPIPAYSASIRADGTVVLHVSSKWQRPGCRLFVKLYKRGVELVYGQLQPDADVAIPKQYTGGLKPGDTLRFDHIKWYSSDFALMNKTYPSFTLSSTGYTEDGVASPRTTWTVTDALGLHVEVEGEYDSVFGSLTFADACGVERSFELEFANQQTDCLYPAIDKDMVLRVVVEKGGSWRIKEYSVRVDSKSSCLSWEGEACVMPWGVSLTDDADFDAETIKVAGKARPVSRYGTGGERKLTLEHADISFVCSEAPKRTAEALKAAHDWVLRAPGGTWHRVCVTGVSRDYTPGAPVDSVKITMQEVE